MKTVCFFLGFIFGLFSAYAVWLTLTLKKDIQAKIEYFENFSVIKEVSVEDKKL